MEFGIFNAVSLLPQYRQAHGALAEHDTQGERRRRHETWPAQDFAEGVAERLVRDRIRSGRIQGAADFGMIECEQYQADFVIFVDPAHVLPPRADRAADTQLERRQQFRERVSVLRVLDLADSNS